MRDDTYRRVVLPGLSFVVVAVALVFLVGTGIIPGVSASPTKQDPTIVNNYYGIDCGTSDSPCYIRQVDGDVLTIDTPEMTNSDCPGYTGGLGVMTCNKSLNVRTDISTTLQVSSTVPLTTTDVPRTWGDGDSLLLLCLLVAIMSKFMVLVIADIAEKNIFVWIYRTLITGIWVAVDILILYPATLRSLDISIYGLWLAVWIFLMILDRAINFFKHLTGGRG